MKSAISKRSKSILPGVGAAATFCTILNSAFGAVTNDFTSSVYFPLPSTGASWTYNANCGNGPFTHTRSIGTNRTISGISTRSVVLSAFAETDYYTSTSTGGISYYGNMDNPTGWTYFATSAPFVMATPKITTSTTVTNSNLPVTSTDPDVSDVTVSGTINVLGFEYIQTDAGYFRALKATITENYTYSSAGTPGYYSNDTTTVWLRRGIGIVKELESSNGVEPTGSYADNCSYSLVSTNWRDYSRFLAANDLVFDWPGYGLWKRTEDGTMTHLHPANAASAVIADLDGNGQGDIVADFGAAYGVWTFMNGSTAPTYLRGGSPDSITAANLDGDAKTDLVFDYGIYGLWKFTNNGTWTLVHSANATRVVAGNTNGSGVDEMIVDFGPSVGTFVYVNGGTTPVYLTSGGTSGMDVGDIDGDGKNDVIINFGASFGVWTYTNFNGTSATANSLIFANPSHMVSMDLNANGVQDVIMVIGSDIWAFYDGDTTPIYLRSGPVNRVRVANYNASAKPSLIVDFGATYNTWAFVDNASWSYVHAGGTNVIESGDVNKQ